MLEVMLHQATRLYLGVNYLYYVVNISDVVVPILSSIANVLDSARSGALTPSLTGELRRSALNLTRWH